MAIYQISELTSSLLSASNEGYEFVEISEFIPTEEDIKTAQEEDYDCVPTLDLNYIDAVDFFTSESICAVELPDNYSIYNQDPSKHAPSSLTFTYEELALLRHALENAIAYVGNLSKKPSYSVDQKKSMKHSSASWRNLKDKIQKALNS